ncbi:MAG: CRISPR-associated endonuclease Cas1 [Chloroflexi bacterium]|nr:CRISPR-associated endonuclease Cas1 [Chloroflexota bacterium]
MLNEFAYCPRLAYLEWVQGEFADSVDTVEGRFQHRRVDRPGGDLPALRSDGAGDDAEQDESAGDTERIHARSVTLSDETLGAIARIDLVEGLGTSVSPVDYKHGRAPDLPEGAWEPERVQVCLQGLLLRANGYQCSEGMLYFVESKERVVVPFDEALVERTLALVRELRAVAASGQIPPPLVDSPRCPRCSLVGICLPDEVNLLSVPAEATKLGGTRRLVPARDDALPLYVQTQGAYVGKSGDLLEIKLKGAVLQKARLLEVSHLAVYGNVQVSTQAIRELCDRNIPVCYFTYGGWFQGITFGMAHKNVELRCRQHAAAAAPEVSLPIARQIVFGKIKNCRTLLRRNHRESPPAVLAELDRLAAKAHTAGSMETLLGIEGAAARCYFSELPGMLKSDALAFDFRGRNRRPPLDPVNAILSFLYSLLIKQAMVTALAVGFDPYLGFYHQPKYGKPALALDLVEEFRPIVADSVCIGLINNGEIGPEHLVRRSGAVALTQHGRRKVIEAYERRMDTLITHPLFGYAVSYRRILEVQARLLARHLLGELRSYPVFRTR